MTIELRTVARKASEVFAEKVRDAIRGHTLEEEANVARILSGNIAPEDIEGYKQRLVGDAARQSFSLSISYPQGSILTSSSAPYPVLMEIERQKALTPGQLRDEVTGDARQKAKEWKLKPTV